MFPRAGAFRRDATARARRRYAAASRSRCPDANRSQAFGTVFSSGQQPNFRRGVRFDRAVMEDVACGDAAFGEAARNQETTMTIERFALGAHQTDARSPRVVEEPVKTSDVAGGNDRPAAMPQKSNFRCLNLTVTG